MKILFLSQRFLLPMDTGGKIRTGNILKHLSKKHHITLISNVESPKDDAFISQVNSLCSRFIPVPWKELKRDSPAFWGRLALQLFSLFPVNVLNDYSKRLRNAVELAIRKEKFDLAICDFVQSALMFRRVKGIPCILFQHNVESMIPKRHLKMAKNPISRLFWGLQWKKMAWFEKQTCRKFDTIIAVSEQDKAIFETLYGLENVHTIPTGVDIDFFKPMQHVREMENTLVFCGSMDWLPNEDAMLFFIRDIFPLVKKAVPDAKLTIVGRSPRPSLQKIGRTVRGIVLRGRVEDIRPFIAAGTVVIVPIRIGGGTRMKIFEAMAMAKPIVSTTIGAEGLPVSNGETIVIEDNPHKMAGKIIELLRYAPQRKRIGSNATALVRENFSWNTVATEFEKICKKTVDMRNSESTQ